MTRANTEDGSSALPFIFLSFVLQPGAITAFTLVAVGSFLDVAITLKMEKLSSPGSHHNESLHSHVLSIICTRWENLTAEVASTAVITDTHPKPQFLPEVLKLKKWMFMKFWGILMVTWKTKIFQIGVFWAPAE